MSMIGSIESRDPGLHRRRGVSPPARKVLGRRAPGWAAAALDNLRTSARALWTRARRRPAPVAFALMAALVCASLLAVHFVRAYTSDDVAVQVVLASWRPGDPHAAWLAPDTFIIKAPLYAVLGALLPHSPGALLATVLILNLIGFGLFFAAYRSLLGRAPTLADYLPILWLASLGYAFFRMLLTPNTRNAEIGLAFALLALVASLSLGRHRWRPRRAREVAVASAAGVAALGLFVYNDPAFLYLLVVPLTAALALRFFLRRERRDLALALLLAAALPAGGIWSALFSSLHLVARKTEAVAASPAQLGPHARMAFRGLVTLFDADVLTATGPAEAVHRLVNAALLALIFAAPLLLWHARHRLTWWHWFVLVQPYYVVLVYIASNQVTDVNSARYMFLAPFYGAIVLALLVRAVADTARPPRRALTGVLLAGLLLNIAATAPTLMRGSRNPNARNAAIVEAARAHGLTKGYARYWSGNINTYLSGDQIQFIPTVCGQDGLHVYHWFMDDRVLTLPAGGGRTFYVYEDNAPPGEICPPELLRQQLGPPAQVIPVDAHTQLFVYDGDITPRIHMH